jgi:hypothetical protein
VAVSSSSRRSTFNCVRICAVTVECEIGLAFRHGSVIDALAALIIWRTMSWKLSYLNARGSCPQCRTWSQPTLRKKYRSRNFFSAVIQFLSLSLRRLRHAICHAIQVHCLVRRAHPCVSLMTRNLPIPKNGTWVDPFVSDFVERGSASPSGYESLL